MEKSLSSDQPELGSQRGIPVAVYKARGQSFSNQGLSATHEELLLVVESGGIYALGEVSYPAVRILLGGLADTIRAIPVEGGPPGSVGPMMGGCYIASSDSRFGAECQRVLGRRFY